jgi:predicted nucleic acid-binding protein
LALERRRVAIDASLAINFVIPAQPYHSQAVALLRSWGAEKAFLVAPPLFESEADSVMRRYVSQGLLGGDAGKAAQELLDALPVAIVQDARVRGRARQIAEAFNQDRVYDATYSALAELLGCEFWTADQTFHQAVKNGLDYVRFVGEFAARPS